MSSQAKLILLVTALYLLFLLWRFIRSRSVKGRVKAFARNAVEMSPAQFLRLYRRSWDRKGFLSKRCDYPGVYILYNKTQNMYYVGQAASVLWRINQHLTGHGNGDVYADYKYGDRFVITSIRLRGSGFASLNELERHAIAAYKADSDGYNKTRGNRG